MIHTKVSTTDGENDGYITISPPAGGADKFMTYMNEGKTTKFKILKAPGATTEASTTTEAPATTQAPTTTAATTESQTPAGTSPATGDSVNISMLLVLLALSGMGILAFISLDKKANR